MSVRQAPKAENGFSMLKAEKKTSLKGFKTENTEGTEKEENVKSKSEN